MQTNPLKFLELFHDAGLEFVIVGGVALRLWGSKRLTHDLDIVPALSEASWKKAIQIVWDSGARPRIPESLDRISDLRNIRRWKKDKNLVAITFRSADQTAEIDFLIGANVGLDELKKNATEIVLDGRRYLVASIDDLISMKKSAGRPQDLLDVTELESIQKRLTD